MEEPLEEQVKEPSLEVKEQVEKPSLEVEELVEEQVEEPSLEVEEQVEESSLAPEEKLVIQENTQLQIKKNNLHIVGKIVEIGKIIKTR